MCVCLPACGGVRAGTDGGACACRQAYAYKLVKWVWFERFILGVILINTVFLAMDSPTLVREPPAVAPSPCALAHPAVPP